MARKARSTTPQTALFSDSKTRRARRRRVSLFLPKLLAEKSGAKTFQTPQRDAAHAVIVKWADLDAAGALERHKETSLNADFLNEVFGVALGYATKTDAPEAYNLEREWYVQGVGTADGALGIFPDTSPVAVVELKAATADLDRSRFNGRTPVQQCWDYLNAIPVCPWGIVSNFRTIRLYHREKSSRLYEEFSLQDLRERTRFNEFYYLLERGGLIGSALSPARAPALLNATTKRQKEVGDELYSLYSHYRSEMILYLHRHEKRELPEAISIAQRLIDRVIFIAFCEDRDLLPEETIDRTIDSVPPFHAHKNPRWRNFLDLFRAMDTGHPRLAIETGYNGNLFKPDPAIDELQLPDEPWTSFFKSLGRYDFRDEVNVEVLGHLFEKSISELERLRTGGLFETRREGARTEILKPAPMPKSAERKLFGIYYTPPEFTGLIVQSTIERLARERFAAAANALHLDPERPDTADRQTLCKFWHACLQALQTLRVVDPACGSGAFLIRAYDSLEELYHYVVDGLAAAEDADAHEIETRIPDLILAENLHGVDVSPEAVEITQLALWIRSARPGVPLSDLSENVKCANSLVADSAVHPRAKPWPELFPAIVAAGGFDCVIGNPPWERVKLQEREFFALHDPQTAQAVSAADRKRRIADLPARNPALHDTYVERQAEAQRMLDYARAGAYPLTGKGDVNTYMLFAELASRIVHPGGLVGLLTPSGIATDDTTKEFFNALVENERLVLLYDFENKRPWFADVHRSFKFSVLVFGGEARKTKATDFVFFARDMEDLQFPKRHIPLTAKDLALFNPNTGTCPIFRSRRDADLTRAIYRRVPVLVDHSRKRGGDPWGVRFVRMFDQTNDAKAGKFHTEAALKKRGFKPHGARFVKGKQVYLPLYEAKMVQAYDHRAASVVVEAANWMRQGQKEETSDVQHANPEFSVLPRFWVSESDVEDVIKERAEAGFIGFKDITSPTNQRTMIASAAPWAGYTNHFVLIRTSATQRRQLCLLANLNSFALDFACRQKIGGVTLNFFIVEQLPILPPDVYDEPCPWDKCTKLETWISDRVLKLSCTADDMLPLASACDFKGSTGAGVHKWRPAERAELLAELDAAFFHLYGIDREDAAYILSTFPHIQARDQAGLTASDTIADVVLQHFDGVAMGG